MLASTILDVFDHWKTVREKVRTLLREVVGYEMPDQGPLKSWDEPVGRLGDLIFKDQPVKYTPATPFEWVSNYLIQYRPGPRAPGFYYTVFDNIRAFYRVAYWLDVSFIDICEQHGHQLKQEFELVRRYRLLEGEKLLTRDEMLEYIAATNRDVTHEVLTDAGKEIVPVLVEDVRGESPSCREMRDMERYMLVVLLMQMIEDGESVQCRVGVKCHEVIAAQYTRRCIDATFSQSDDRVRACYSKPIVTRDEDEHSRLGYTPLRLIVYPTCVVDYRLIKTPAIVVVHTDPGRPFMRIHPTIPIYIKGQIGMSPRHAELLASIPCFPPLRTISDKQICRIKPLFPDHPGVNHIAVEEIPDALVFQLTSRTQRYICLMRSNVPYHILPVAYWCTVERLGLTYDLYLRCGRIFKSPISAAERQNIDVRSEASSILSEYYRVYNPYDHNPFSEQAMSTALQKLQIM